MRAPRVALSMLITVWALAGCSAIPNLDHGSAGCQNATGIGPVPAVRTALDRAGIELIGEHTRRGFSFGGAVAALGKAQGHTVVFNVQIEGYGECWCVPPPEGTVSSVWFNAHGALFLGVDGVDVGHTANDQLFAGWGC